MDEIFPKLVKGQQVVLETAYEVVEIDKRRNMVTLRNLRNGETVKHSDYWFQNIQLNGFNVHIIDID